MAEGNRRIDDAGVKIGGARKDYAKERMASSDVEAMTDEERVMNIQKDNVWPKPDYAALVEAGMAPAAAAQVKIIRDRIAKAPSLSSLRPHSTTLGWYFDTLRAVGDHLEACRTLEEVRNVYYVLEKSIGLKEDRLLAREGRAKFYSINKGRSHPVYSVSYEDDPKIKALLSQGFPGDVPAWRRGHMVKQYAGRPDFLIVKGTRNVIKTGFETEQAALDWLKDQWEQAKAAKAGSEKKKKVPDRPHLDHVERTGLPDRRDGSDVSPQTFIDVFGFRAVEFGEWLPDDERQRVLNHGYDALMDLAAAIGFEPGQISLDGTLAIAFGARGQSGFAAHYEPGRRVVNLTRLSGAGALAHEWGHALDHFVGTGTTVPMEIQSVSGWYKRLDDCRPNLAHRGGAVSAAAFNLMREIRTRPKTRQEAAGECTANVEGFTRSVASYEKIIASRTAKAEAEGKKPNAAEMRKLDRARAEQQKGLDYWTRRLASVNATPDGGDFGRATSSYYTEAAKISGSDGYWARPTELFARGFESYVNDALEAEDGSSNYLVAWADERFYPEELYKGNPYPVGEERKRLNGAWDGLMSQVVEFVPDRSSTPPMALPKPIAPTAK